ncbi:MAG: glycosyltransferase family 4 protein [Candidatus Moraniibacteriota bacterium]|jgi:glycosyltransferase involved in cell wall biosynthesis
MSSIENSSQIRKNILFVTRPLSPPWDEASKNFAYNLACNITNHNITILVDEYIDDAPKNIIQKKIYSNNHFSFLQKVRLLRYLKKHTEEFDVVHLLFTPTKLNSWLMKKILHRRDAINRVSPQPQIVQTVATLRDDLYSKEELQEMLFGDTVVTYSKWANNKLNILDFTNAKQIYPGFNLSKYIPTEKSTSLMKKWNISKDNFVVTYPGEFVRLGATDTIVEAFIKLWNNPSNAHIKYLCACRIKNEKDARKKQEVIEKITAAGYIDKVYFTDTFSDMNAVYNLSDTVIFPVENMNGKFDVPLAMIEPYACKKPVIASDLELFKEFSSNEINVIIPGANSDALIDAILKLEKNPEKRKLLGENAFTFAHETFNIERVATEYTEIYNR